MNIIWGAERRSLKPKPVQLVEKIFSNLHSNKQMGEVQCVLHKSSLEGKPY